MARAGRGLSEGFDDVPVVSPATGMAGAWSTGMRAAEIALASGGALRVCPGRENYPLVDWVLSPIPELCAREGITLVLDFAPGPIAWVEVVPFARQFPSVRMIVLDVNIHDPAALAALDATANVVLELQPVDAAELEGFVSVFGRARCVVPAEHGAS